MKQTLRAWLWTRSCVLQPQFRSGAAARNCTRAEAPRYGIKMLKLAPFGSDPEQKQGIPNGDFLIQVAAQYYIAFLRPVLAIGCLLHLTLAAAAATGAASIPRPDLFRENWMSLNGEWQFEIDPEADGESRGLTHGRELADRITVPFAPESQLSGLGYGNSKRLKDVWYRSHFELPSSMVGQRVRLHFGAVDYAATVFVNGHFAGQHVGCSAAFAFEITELLKNGSNEVVVKVHDNMWSWLQPRGKQAVGESRNVFYTRTTGIWQSVWLEAVGSTFIEHLVITPDPDHSRVLVEAKLNGDDNNLLLKAEAFIGARRVGSAIAEGPWRQQLALDLTETRLWEPGAPFLYDLHLTLFSAGEQIDELESPALSGYSFHSVDDDTIPWEKLKLIAF